MTQPIPSNDNLKKSADKNGTDLPDFSASQHHRLDGEVPYNIEIESALLGAILRDQNAYDDIITIVPRPEYFYHKLHQKIYYCIYHLKEKGGDITPYDLIHFFRNGEDGMGGQDIVNYLTNIVTQVPSIRNAVHYANTVKDLYRRRELLKIGSDIVANAYDTSDPSNTSDSQLEQAEEKLFNLIEKDETEKGLESFVVVGDKLMEFLEQRRKHQILGVRSGFDQLDETIGGLNRSDFIVLAARPGMGKTAFAISLAAQVAGLLNISADPIPEENLQPKKTEKKHVLFFSLEMSSQQLLVRLLAQMTGVASDKSRRGLTDQDFQKFYQTLNHFRQSENLFIDDTPGLSISTLRQRIRRNKRKMKGQLDLVVVDYLQLMQPSQFTRHDNRVSEITEISRGLKIIAKEFDVPVVALAQLSRDIEKRQADATIKIPQLSDLRDSGSIEQDADIVCFLFREEYYIEQKIKNSSDATVKKTWQDKKDKVKNKTELHISKNRHGKLAVIPFHFDQTTTRFIEFDGQHSYPPTK